jgi:small subunit ribosomal protein S14
MTTQSAIAKQKKRERLVLLKQEKRARLKALASNVHLSEEERASAREALNHMPRNSSRVRLRNRCQITGRPRGFLRKFHISRLCFREMANAGLIPGVTKASW